MMPPKDREVTMHLIGIKMAANEQYRIRFTMKADDEDAEVMIYSDIVSSKWFDDETSTVDFDKALKDAKKKGARNLNIRINSPGGEVYAAVAMRSMVINAGFDSVRVMVEGLCASAATLFATIPGARVVIAEGSEFMIHNPHMFTWGDADEIEKSVDHLRKMEQQFHGMYAARTGKTEDQIKEWMDATTWFTAKEAVDYGFCDELLASQPIAACVTKRDMALMRSIYGDVPEMIAERDDAQFNGGIIKDSTTETMHNGDNTQEYIIQHKHSPDEFAREVLRMASAAITNEVSNGTPVAGVPTENILKKGDHPMELNEHTTVDQLREANPALLAQVQQDAVAAERERLSDIDALTIPGYEDMANQAKENGTSALDFQKQIVAAMKQKGTDYMAARQKETAPAADVAGGAPEADRKNEDKEIADCAKDIAEYAKLYTPGGNDSMF